MSKPVEQLRAAIETPETVSFWGAKHTITPRLVAEALGDGRKLIWFETMDHRPNYYVLRVDSTWALDSDDNAADYIVEHYEEIVGAIIDEYGGMCADSDCDGEDCCHCHRGFPEYCGSSGTSWGEFTELNDKTKAAMANCQAQEKEIAK